MIESSAVPASPDHGVPVAPSVDQKDDKPPEPRRRPRPTLFKARWEARVRDPIIVTISHRLGRDRAKRRLDLGLGGIRARLAAFVSSVEYAWTGYRLDFTVTALRQTVVGRVDIEEDLARIEIGLPLLLRIFASKIIARVRREGTLLLDKSESK